MPSVLGSGNGLIVSLTAGEMTLGLVVITFVVKLLFFGSQFSVPALRAEFSSRC